MTNKYKKIAMCGKIASGKTSIAKFLSKYHGYEFHSFGNGIRDCFNSVFKEVIGRGIDKTKDRKLLEYIGTLGRDNSYKDHELEKEWSKENDVNILIFYALEKWIENERKILFKTDDVGDEFWIKRELTNINSDLAVIDDCRYPNEFTKLKDDGYIIIRLNCNKKTAAERARVRDGDFDLKSFDSQIEKYHLDFPVDYEVDANQDLGEVCNDVLGIIYEGNKTNKR
jgi:dephospho-CoA kinase